MAKGILLVIAPHRNAKLKGGVMRSRADMMSDSDSGAGGMDGATDEEANADDDQEDKGENEAECTLPLDSLQDSDAEPQVGDRIGVSIEGTIESVHGSYATITVHSVNGQPVGGEDYGDETPQESQGGPETLGDMGARLRKKAQDRDGGAY